MKNLSPWRSFPFLLLVLLAAACARSEGPVAVPNNPGGGSIPENALQITGLTALPDSLEIGERSTITAQVNKSWVVEYHWTASSGQIIDPSNGRRSSVTFVSGSCCSGIITIECRASDAEGRQARRVARITVLDPAP